MVNFFQVAKVKNKCITFASSKQKFVHIDKKVKSPPQWTVEVIRVFENTERVASARVLE